MTGLSTGTLWQIDIPRTLAHMTNVALFLKNSQEGPYRRVTRRIGERVDDLRGGSAPFLIQDIHDLPLSAAQLTVCVVRHESSAPCLGC